MNEIFAKNLINAVAGKKVDVELDKDFLNMLDIAFSERIKGLEKTVLMMRFGQETIVRTTAIASRIGISSKYAKELLDSGLRNAESGLSLSYFKNDADTQRNLCFYFAELIRPLNEFSQQILQRAGRVHKVASFDLNANDPYFSEFDPDIKKTSFYVALIERLCAIDIDNCPPERLGCLCVEMSEAERRMPSYIPCIINREINCARVERSANIRSWHAQSFGAIELELGLHELPGLGDLADLLATKNIFKVKDALAYEAAELAPQIGNPNVKMLEKALIDLSNGAWKGYNQYWERYYSWEHQ